ncbi:MAG: RloB family protein [Candidatus Methanoplasma sp.]|jgi:hypothetical protein|nr:RloB family protein [Candidatus Methanoplasma sp.]
MRPRESKLNTVRGNKRLEVKRKFILAFEGYRTEAQYFKGVGDNRSKLRIPSLIEICPLDRYPIQSGSSDPGRILDLLEEYLIFLDCGKYPVDLFINAFIADVIPEKDILGVKDKIDKFTVKAKKMLQTLCDGNDLICDPDKAKETCSEIYCGVFDRPEKVHFDVPEPIDYRKERDIVCVIVDRDAESRDSAKCSEFFSRCQKNAFRPYMTNPCFEMWLLLHFDEVLGEDKKVLRRNEKIGDVRYTERRLDGILRSYPANSGYRKDDLDFDCFMHRVDNAIKNEKRFCCEIKCIKNEVGSNIGALIDEMRHKN